MISFNALAQADPASGHEPGLGNQLYRYASLKGIAASRGYRYCIPPDTLLTGFFTLDGVTLEARDAPVYRSREWIDTFRYSESYVRECPDDVDLYGDFFSEKYFRHIEAEVREDLTFKPSLLDIASSIRRRFDTEVIGIQVRRGDYLGCLPCCEPDYFVESIAYIDACLGKTLPVFVFSNDPVWCMRQSAFRDERFRFVVDADLRKHSGRHAPQTTCDSLTYTREEVDSQGPQRRFYVPDYGHSLCLMTLCDHFVISNSTFGIWGAWLARRGGIVIRPAALWDDDGESARDYYPEGWLRRQAWPSKLPSDTPCRELDDFSVQIEWGSDRGFFACCTAKLFAAIRHCNVHGILPRIDSSAQFGLYKDGGAGADITEWFFRPSTPPRPAERPVEVFASRGQTRKSGRYMEELFEGFTVFGLACDPQYAEYRTLNHGQLEPFLNGYFSRSDAVRSLCRQLEARHAIDVSRTIAIYFRGLDKTREALLPDYAEMRDKLLEVRAAHPGHRLLVQSDEIEFHHFIARDFRVVSFAGIPKGRRRDFRDRGLHHHLRDGDRPGEAQRFLAIVDILSRCDQIILNSSHVGLWISLLRGHADGLHQYLDQWRD